MHTLSIICAGVSSGGILKMRPVTVFAGTAMCVLTGYCFPFRRRVSSFS